MHNEPHEKEIDEWHANCLESDTEWNAHLEEVEEEEVAEVRSVLLGRMECLNIIIIIIIWWVTLHIT